MESSPKKVCIVGGGPSGIVSLRRVLDSPVLTGTLYEQKDDIGGQWNYKGVKEFPTSPRNISQNGVGGNGYSEAEADPEMFSTMYDDLSCNLPYPLMEFRDFPHPKNQNTFATQKEIHQYMRDYATHFKLWPNIVLNTAIVNIRPETPITSPGEPGRWIVETHNHKEDVLKTEVFDAVIVCTGKNSYPYRPAIPGLDDFTGKVVHSKYFKNAEGFRGKNVVMIGLGPTLADLALSISETADKVTVCHKFPLGLKLGVIPENVREVENVKLVTRDGVVTEKDEAIPCDVIILCTGYGLKFPFFDPECGIEVIEEKYVPNLYNMTVYTKKPTLAILNMCYRSPEYIIIEIQARYFVSCLEGTTKLPPYEQMESVLTAQEEERRKLGKPYSNWFEVGDFGTQSWTFFRKLAEDIGLKAEYKHIPLLEQLYLTVLYRIFGKLALYKKDVLKKLDEHTWELLLHHDPKLAESKPGKTRMILNPDSTVTVETLEIPNGI